MSGYMEKKRVRKLKVVRVKELLFSAPVCEIAADDPRTEKIRFKSVVSITLAFPVEAFAPDQ